MTGYIGFLDMYGHIRSDSGGLEVQGLQVPLQDVACISLGKFGVQCVSRSLFFLRNAQIVLSTVLVK